MPTWAVEKADPNGQSWLDEPILPWLDDLDHRRWFGLYFLGAVFMIGQQLPVCGLNQRFKEIVNQDMANIFKGNSAVRVRMLAQAAKEASRNRLVSS